MSQQGQLSYISEFAKFLFLLFCSCITSTFYVALMCVRYAINIKIQPEGSCSSHNQNEPKTKIVLILGLSFANIPIWLAEIFQNGPGNIFVYKGNVVISYVNMFAKGLSPYDAA